MSDQPIDYSSGFNAIPSPGDAFMSGIKNGVGISQLQQQRQQAELAAQQQAQMRADLSELSKNPTTQAIGAMSVKYPQLSENFKRSFDMLDPGQKQAKLDQATQVYAALHSDQPDIAEKLLREQAVAARNSGNEKDAKGAEVMADLVKAHPEFAKTTAGLMISSALGPDKFATAFPALGGEQRANDQAPADLAKKNADAVKAQADAKVAVGTVPALIEKPVLQNKDTISQIQDRAKRLALDQDKLTTETQIRLTELKQKFGELPAPIVKDQADAVTESISSAQSAEKMNDLANRLSKEGGGYGGLSSASEWIKKATGNQNEMTRLRAEYNRIVTPAAMSAYKQVASGSTSDKDIETAMIGVPKDNADAETMAAFLRGTAKLQTYNSILSNAKSEWLGEVKGLGKAKSDLDIDGVKVAAGTTFKDFTDQYVARKMIQTRSYMRHANGASGQY